MTPDEFKTRFSTPAHPEGCPVLMVVEILRLRAALRAIVVAAGPHRMPEPMPDTIKWMGERANEALNP